MIHAVFSITKLLAMVKGNIILNLLNPAGMCRSFALCTEFIRTTMMQNHRNTKDCSWRINIPRELCTGGVKPSAMIWGSSPFSWSWVLIPSRISLLRNRLLWIRIHLYLLISFLIFVASTIYLIELSLMK